MSFEDGVISYLPRLTRYAKALTHNTEDADDLVQNTFLRAITQQEKFEVGTNLRAWLFTLMHNTHINGVRKSNREMIIKNTIKHSCHEETIEADQEEKMKLREVEKALMEIPEDQRKIIMMSATSGWKYEELADFFNVPLGTVRSRMARGRETLREMVGR